LAAAQPIEQRAARAEQYTTGIRTFVLTLVFVSLLTGLGIYQVWQRYQVYALGLELSTQTLQYRALLEEERRLRLELATMKRAGSIRQQAGERLEMRIPAPQDVVEVN